MRAIPCCWHCIYKAKQKNLDQYFSTGVPWNPRVPPAQSRGSARSYPNATIDGIF